MEKILVSSCLLGEKVRYHGGDALVERPLLQQWRKEKRLISICPEVRAGASIPRSPSEIIGDGGGAAVLAGTVRIKNKADQDVTDLYTKAAHIALDTAKRHDIKLAILKDGSPSCGSTTIYDGSFSGKKITQAGITATLLRQNGIKVFSEQQIDEADAYLRSIDEDYIL